MDRGNERIETAKREAESNYQTRGLHPVADCAQSGASACRMSARAVLEQRYEALLREANGLHALLQALPGSMGPAAEEALWKIVIEQRQ
jgi:hypothetical protein